MLRCTRTGFLRGWFQTNELNGTDALNSSYIERERDFRCRVNAVRIVFIVCASFLVLSLILFYAKGIAAVGKSLSDVDYVTDVSSS